ncbi:MAG: pyridoxamine 5'-phosphate oxidase family protein [Propionicimonas sp.]|uniref:pyridoxamine 5'-phosphate oxidase family protein n=1 Tax=Propionicimonas sp. TaxID=1955623 RepID=UPI003D0B1311
MSDERNDLATLQDLVKPGAVVMLATVGDHEQLEARPMSLEDLDAEGRLWFFTEFDAPKHAQLDADQRVLVTLSGKNHVSIQGTGSVVRDPQRQRDLWNAPAEAWLQCEPTDPKVGLLVVQATGAQYWKTPGIVSAALGVAIAAVKGDRPDLGTNETLELS